MRLLLTGGTGFLGGAITAELAGSPFWDDARFLVHAATREEGAARLRATLARFEVPAAQQERVRASQVILGDLRDLDAIFQDAAMAEVTHVINCAAIATLSNHPLL